MASNLIGNEAPLSGVASSNLVFSAFRSFGNRFQTTFLFIFRGFCEKLLDFFSFFCYDI